MRATGPLIDSLDDNFLDVGKARDLNNQKFNNWKVLGYKGNQHWLCECQCKKHTRRIIKIYDLINGLTKSCGCTRHKDITGQMFGNWLVKEYAGDGYWICECQCDKHTIKEVRASYLKNGSSTSCGCIARKKAAEHMRQVAKSRLEDITNLEIGYWKAISYVGESVWNFECQVCGNIIKARKRDVSQYRKCNKHELPCNIHDLTGKQFNSWKVISYAGNKSWLCECDCENHTRKIIKAQRLKSGDSKSCGCKKEYYSLISYGYSEEQANIIQDRDSLIKLINDKFKYKPTLHELAKVLCIGYQLTVRIVNRLDIRDYINYNYNNSHLEEEVLNWVKSISNTPVISSDRTILNGIELDIYIPDKRLAIEFNGDYWHSTLNKDKYYHQQKTLACAKKGIQLIHIFEHEWVNSKFQNKIKNIIKRKLDLELKVVDSKDIFIKELDSNQYKQFLDLYSIYNFEESDIKLGCYKNNELVGALGIVQYNNEYKISRLCWKDNISINNGIEKILKYITVNYNIESIKVYNNITKFTSESYIKAGFKPLSDRILTEPNYKWVNTNFSVISDNEPIDINTLSKVNEEELDDETYDELMYDLGLLRVYDSGNMVLEWRR